MNHGPLYGVILEEILIQLHSHYGWEGLAERMRVNCFKFELFV
jgi:uncharacterized protein (DUF2132 family)